MLAQEVTHKYAERVRFRVEDLGASPIGKRFGIDKYPAVFVDDALVARPEDFYAWGGPETGRYVPWKDVANRRRFQDDLKRLIDLRLAGLKVESLAPSAAVAEQKRPLPSLKLTDLNGRTFRFADLRGKKVIVEVWATWCPLCLDTMRWLSSSNAPAGVEVVAVTVESERSDIDRIVAEIHPRGRIVIASADLRAALNGPPAIPTLLVADDRGRIVKTFYGAPADLHEQILSALAAGSQATAAEQRGATPSGRHAAK